MKPNKPTLERAGDIDRRLSEQVRLQLRIADISQASAARALGHARSTLGHRLQGRRALTGSDLVKLAWLTGTSVIDLVPTEYRI